MQDERQRREGCQRSTLVIGHGEHDGRNGVLEGWLRVRPRQGWQEARPEQQAQDLDSPPVLVSSLRLASARHRSNQARH